MTRKIKKNTYRKLNKIMKNKGCIIALMCILIASCKSTKSIKNSTNTLDVNTKSIIKNHNANKSVFSTLKATLKVSTKTIDKEENVVANIRILKDQKIWVSISKLGYTGAKILITPKRVQFYNKRDKEYFDGDFTFISNWLGTNLSFKQLQAILLGESMYPLDANKYNKEILNDGFVLIPKKQDLLIEHFITIYSNNFKIKAQEIAQNKLLRILNIEYLSYQENTNQIFPLLMSLSLVDKNSETQVSIDYKNISLNQELRYPFKIPTNYKEISFEK
tara:strand:- start:634 stop:1461 length:828 start_codon:yes stop_codon:yes gene_type:complete